MVFHESKLLYFLEMSVVENCSCARAIDNEHCIGLSSELLTDEFLLCCSPDRKNAADREVGVDDGASVERIESDVETVSFSNNFQMRTFLTGEAFNDLIFFEMSLNDLITLDILMELFITKFIGGSNLVDGRVSNEERYLFGSIEDSLYDRCVLSL